MKALIVRLSSIGDVVHTLPALCALRRHGWEAGWLVEPAARPLLEGHPLLDHVIPVPASRPFRAGEARRALRSLRAQVYDVALDFQGLWKSAAWARLAGARRTLGFGGSGRRERLSGLLLSERLSLPRDVVHVIDKNLALLRPLGVEAIGLREFGLPAVEPGPAVTRAVAEAGGRGFAILNPGGGWASKRWPPEGYGAVARALGERGLCALVTFGPGEEVLADRAVSASGGSAIRCPPTGLLEYAELARRARLVVAADTGPLHIACAVAAPVVGIFGPTDPARNGPFSPHDVVVRRAPPCAPCHRRRCAVHEGVMDSISPQEVVAAIDRRLGLARGLAVLAV